MRNVIVFFLLAFAVIMTVNSSIAQVEFSLIEEDQKFWEELLGQKDINNRNMLYASYLAYKERLTELSIESFIECKKRNESNDIVKTVSSYYIAKNYYLLGRYNEAILYFTEADGANLGRFGNLLHAIRLNKAITYLKMNNTRMFREMVNSVIESDDGGKYGSVGRAMLNQFK